MKKQQAHNLDKNFVAPQSRGSNSQPTVAYIVEHTLGCKWMLEVLRLIRIEISRPGAMTRSLDGLTTKVLNERLSDLLNFSIVGFCCKNGVSLYDRRLLLLIKVFHLLALPALSS